VPVGFEFCFEYQTVDLPCENGLQHISVLATANSMGFACWRWFCSCYGVSHAFFLFAATKPTATLLHGSLKLTVFWQLPASGHHPPGATYTAPLVSTTSLYPRLAISRLTRMNC